MNANQVRRTPATTRLAGLALALVLSTALVTGITQSMHIERFGQGAPVVELDAVVVKPAHTSAGTEIARAEPAARTQATN